MDSDDIGSLVLDDATLSQDSFNVILGETNAIADISLVGLTFSGGEPADLNSLLGIATFDNVIVDQAHFDRYTAEFNSFAAMDGNSLTVVYFGDSNLDGEFNSSDFVAVFKAGKYESELEATWGEGDWDRDGVFNSSDLVVAFHGGGYEQGPKAAVSAVPEPSGTISLICALTWVAIHRRRTTIRPSTCSVCLTYFRAFFNGLEQR